ncbi:MAG: hypothetical protein HOP31_03030 [Ignavibacteria bacterium]|nr:hypothetical protein [Ignavibacteria bacterium]
MKCTSLAFLLLLAVILIAAPGSLKSQSLHILESKSTDGEPVGEKTTFYMSSDQYKENFVYMLVKFPGAYGKSQILFRAVKVGEPGPVSWVDIDPSATWYCYEMYIPQWGEYTLTVTDVDNNLIAETKITMKAAK